MKFLHLSDLHLGKSVNGFSLLPDQKDLVLRQIPQLIKDQNIDAVLIAGDVYDRAIPPEGAVTLLDDFLTKLSSMNIPVLAISGNHDSDERLNFGSRVFVSGGIHIAGKYEGRLPEVTLADDYGEVHVWLMPYLQSSLVRQYYPDEKIETYEDAVRVAIAHTDIDYSLRNIMVSHQFVAGIAKAEPGEDEQAPAADEDSVTGSSLKSRTYIDPEIGGSETKAVSVGTIDRIGSDLYEKFDYTALGHIHRPQKVGSEKIRYSGSPLKYSLREAADEKSFLIVELKEKGTEPVFTTIPVRPLHDMCVIEGRYDDLLQAPDPSHLDDYVFFELTDETPVPDALSVLQTTYPNAMGLRYRNLEKLTGISSSESGSQKDMTFEEKLQAFSTLVRGKELTEEELAILKKAAEEAGVQEVIG